MASARLGPVFNLELLSSDKEIGKIILTNIVGATVREWNSATKLNIQDITNGIYLLRILDKEGKSYNVSKVIKQ